ncbi:MAG: HAMP domain-containing protein [Lachnospiraceae bacterium]|nr:HAMP domain-containing protein [Lachnospiraceae bacterium]
MISRLKSFRKRHSTIFIKVYINYAVLVLIFAILIGLVFILLYRNSNNRIYQDKLAKKAQMVSVRLASYIVDEDYEECLNYLSILREVDETEMWLIAKKDARQPMNEAITSFDFAHEKLQPEYVEVIKDALVGKTDAVSFFSLRHDATTFTAGTPVYAPNGEVCGALVLIETMAAMDELTSTSTSIIVVSSVVALIVAFILAVAFARQISRPILMMRAATIELAEGNYSVKTGIAGNDEIAELSTTIDQLAVKLRENEEIRKNMEQMRIDFFANVSHELRTPIAVVRAYTESLVDKVVTDEEQIDQYHMRMLGECRSMERLVGDLLTLSKMQNPDFEVEKEPVNVVQIFGEISRSVAALGEEKNVSMEIEKDGDVLMMMGDYDRLRQMFLVICDNAVKFSNENSLIHVKLKKEKDSKLVISIKDDGVGIAPEELPNIFDKFYKSKLRQNAKGSGLGLAIAKHIALKHGGTIDVSSTPGEGTQFVFTFDCVEEKDFEDVL